MSPTGNLCEPTQLALASTRNATQVTSFPIGNNCA